MQSVRLTVCQRGRSREDLQLHREPGLDRLVQEVATKRQAARRTTILDCLVSAEGDPTCPRPMYAHGRRDALEQCLFGKRLIQSVRLTTYLMRFISAVRKSPIGSAAG